jgi:putative phosphoesterase
MKFALIADIHSNHVALHAVLNDIKKSGIRKIYCLGDLIGYGPFPDKVFPLIQENDVITIMGNYEESVIFGKKDRFGNNDNPNLAMAKISFEWAREHISNDNLAFITQLPREIRLNLYGYDILMTHGTPEKINGMIQLDDPEEDLISLMQKAKADILFCAHSHLPFHKIVGGFHIINPGSIGRPRRGSPQAEYAIVDLSDGDCNVRFRLVDYDFESFAKEIETSEMPENNFAGIIRTGYWKF